jgi:hypothetical protein
VHAVDPSTGEREWTTHLEAPAVRAFTVGFGGDGGGAVAENGVLASAAASDNHYEDEGHGVLRDSEFQYLAFLRRYEIKNQMHSIQFNSN